MTPSRIEAAAVALAKPYLEKDTDSIAYYAKARAGKLGWYVVRGTTRVALAYEVEVDFVRDLKSFGRQGSGSTYHFDAATGQCLDKFPGWESGSKN